MKGDSQSPNDIPLRFWDRSEMMGDASTWIVEKNKMARYFEFNILYVCSQQAGQKVKI
jgi:hypothetical protein